MISHRGATDHAALDPKPRSPACELDVTNDRSVRASIPPSLVKDEGDDGFTLIWSRRNGD